MDELAAAELRSAVGVQDAAGHAYDKAMAEAFNSLFQDEFPLVGKRRA